MAKAILIWAALSATLFAQQAKVYRIGEEGVTIPMLVSSVRATYTPAARAAKVQGNVSVEAVVLPDGTVGDVKVVKSELWPYRGPQAKNEGPVALLPDAEVARLRLDKQAIEAVKRWKFKAGTKDGKPVPVRVGAEVRFALSDPPGV